MCILRAMPSRYRTCAVIPLLLISSFEQLTPACAQVNEAQATDDISHLQAQAAAGDAKAQLELARAYEKGEGVPQDVQAAFSWCQKAAEQGDAAAENHLGEMYRSGEGVQRNKPEAVAWYCKAASQGNADAMCNLGIAFYNGDGTEVNDMISYAWFLLAKEGGCPRAEEAVRRAESELKPVKITGAYKQIAELFDRGRCVPRSKEQAARWWLAAGARGDQDAHQMGAAVSSEYGLGVPKDPKKARNWYGRAASSNYEPAMMALADMEAAGKGGPQDVVSACVLYGRLAQNHSTEALDKLAKLRTTVDAAQWRKASEQLSKYHIDATKIDAYLNAKESGER